MIKEDKDYVEYLEHWIEVYQLRVDKLKELAKQLQKEEKEDE